ncbi:uncharacterized protein [Lepeophtheirus salmonis]|uniref:uncharacterized protein n=1 Tax=Lepeophtheirus salmonis TaxID=72036 RepID=UPI001AEA9092|nr:galactoside alpha-(1,2)-fucosyltransferase 1-like [Lepeophtheirus salmonis]XP_040565974.1 galactoside alpha-(1,2)-fucosyltransferase 1-like [Lepeophtheirus salmonis]XP_040565975.1 galactoside alpha-(1,2)-fucosyltransferase 1-like [Lepeophtheirus salmonis]
MILVYFIVLTVFQSGMSSKPWDISNQCHIDSKSATLKKTAFNCPCEPIESLLNHSNKKSVMMMPIQGRLGNRMLAFSLMLAFKRVYGVRTFLESHVLEDVNHYFPRATQIPSIEHNFCMPFNGWENFYGDYQELNTSLYLHGKALSFWPKLRLMDSIVNNKLKLMDLLEKVEPELRRTFVFRKDLQYYVRKVIRNAIDTYKEIYLQTRKKKLKNINKLNITLVGIHVRKRDADRDIVERYNLPKLSPSYYLEAIHMCRKKFKHVIFIIVSDEMNWVYDNLMPRKGSAFLYPAGHGHVNCRTAISIDLALMAACDHSILSYGTFSFWSGWLAGGHRILPNSVFRVSPIEEPFEDMINSFRLPDYGTIGLSKKEKQFMGQGSFDNIS